jgi:hypothetical protein
MPGLIEGHGHLQMNGTSLADIENNRNWEELAIRSVDAIEQSPIKTLCKVLHK